MNTETEAARPYAPGELVTFADDDPPSTLGTVTKVSGAGYVVVRWWDSGGCGGGTYGYEPRDLRRVKIVPAGDDEPQAAGEGAGG